jgi:hypothetical protein
MEQYDDTFEAEEVAPPSIKEIEKRLRKLGCTKEQVARHHRTGRQEAGQEPTARIGLALSRRTSDRA